MASLLCCVIMGEILKAYLSPYYFPSALTLSGRVLPAAPSVENLERALWHTIHCTSERQQRWYLQVSANHI